MVGIVELHVESRSLNFSDYIQVPVFLYTAQSHLLGNTRDIGSTTRANLKERLEKHFGPGSWDGLGRGSIPKLESVSGISIHDGSISQHSQAGTNQEGWDDDSAVSVLSTTSYAATTTSMQSSSSEQSKSSTVSAFKKMGKSFATPRSSWYGKTKTGGGGERISTFQTDFAVANTNLILSRENSSNPSSVAGSVGASNRSRAGRQNRNKKSDDCSLGSMGSLGDYSWTTGP